jgi:isopentenyl diphosphate isomerase/L-lactate dehydrogenase-like FMN-dependent dehydrogenase
MEVLPEIVAAVGSRAGGGTDIVKALAAGAKLVGLGRMQCYALSDFVDHGNLPNYPPL